METTQIISTPGMDHRRSDTGRVSGARVAVYARVSTADQNCESQLNELREYVARRGWTITGEYVDTGWSGSKASRPQLDRLMADASQRRFDCICVFKIDRFGRSVLHLNQQLATLTSYGVRFIAVSQGLDTDQSSPTARLLCHILSSVAEFEKELIRERVRAGVRSAKHRGVKLGRKRVVFDRSRAIAMHEAGTSIKNISIALGVSVGTIHRAITTFKNPFTMGISQVDDSAVSVPAVLVLQQSEECGMRDAVTGVNHTPRCD